MRASGILLLAIAVAARGEDPAQPAADSIAAAKKDLAAIRAAASPAEAGPGLTGIDVRDDALGAGGARADSTAAPPAGVPSAAGPSRGTEGTGNWLVDAMERKPGQKQIPAVGGDLIQGELGLLKDADRPDARAEKEGEPAEASREAESKALAESVYNPLDAFMSSWISAHDREFLLPAARSDSPLAGEQGKAREGTLPAIDLGQRGFLAEGPSPPRDAGLPDSKAAANPYLADMDRESLAPIKPFSAPDLTGIAPLGLPDFSRGMSAPAVDPRALDPSRALTPDFAQPADDDKYFKQLRRF
jgi:hypothetical protein